MLVEIMQLLAGSEGIGVADLEAATAHVERHRVGGVGLQPSCWAGCAKAEGSPVA